jgi:hypothetical protein
MKPSISKKYTTLLETKAALEQELAKLKVFRDPFPQASDPLTINFLIRTANMEPNVADGPVTHTMASTSRRQYYGTYGEVFAHAADLILSGSDALFTLQVDIAKRLAGLDEGQFVSEADNALFAALKCFVGWGLLRFEVPSVSDKLPLK